MSSDKVFQYFVRQKEHDRRQTLLLDTNEEDSVALRLTNIYERLYAVHFAGQFEGHHVLGFIDKREPKILGFVSFNADNLHKVNGIDVWATENVDPVAEAPYMRVGIPAWLRGFTASACMSSRFNLDALDFSATRRSVEKRVVAAVTSAAVRLLLSGRAICESDRDIAIAVDKSPLLHKRLLMRGLPFPLFDSTSADYLSSVHLPIPEACDLARRRGHRLFVFMNKEEFRQPGMIGKIGALYSHKAEVAVITDYWPILVDVLRKILSIDGSIVLQLTKDLNIADFVECRYRDRTRAGPTLTRSQKEQAMADELCWTVPLLYSDGHLDLREFIGCMVRQLECPQCKKHPRPRSCVDHYYILVRQARLLSLRWKKELPKELTFFDPSVDTVKTMEREMDSFPHALLYESTILPGYPAKNEFSSICVPCDMPDILPAKLDF